MQILVAVSGCLRFLVDRVSDRPYTGPVGVKELVKELRRFPLTAGQNDALATVLEYRNVTIHNSNNHSVEPLLDAVYKLERWYKGAALEISSLQSQTAEELVFMLLRLNLERELEVESVKRQRTLKDPASSPVSTFSRIVGWGRTGTASEQPRTVSDVSDRSVTSKQVPEQLRMVNMVPHYPETPTEAPKLVSEQPPSIEFELQPVFTIEEYVEETKQQNNSGVSALLSVITLEALEQLRSITDHKFLKDTVVIRGRLSYIRTRSGSGALKGCRVKILDGKKVNTVGKFNHWAGTTVHIWCKNGEGTRGKLIIPKERIVNVYYSPNLIEFIRLLQPE